MSRSSIFALALLMFPAASRGHTDISEIIKGLTTEIKKTPTADLYYRRGIEYRALRQVDHAITDLEIAISIDPTHRSATIALIELVGPGDMAWALIKHYETFAEDKSQQFEATFLLAQNYLETDMAPVALFLCEGLQTLRPDKDPALDLLQAETLLRLNHPEKASRILKAAWQRTNSIVLRNNWIDTALTAGLTDEILPIIIQEISSSRFRSSWLIRRARAALIHQDKEQAHRDLQAALTEISARMRPTQPDLTLIADRGLIHALLGNHEEARADLDLLDKSILPPSSYRLLSDQLK